MNPQDATNKAFELLREIPVEVSIENVGSMVATFPVLQHTGSWLSNINLNSILMTTAGTLLIGTSNYLMNTASPVPEPLKAEALVPVVDMVEEPIVLVEEAVVWSAPPAEPKAIPPVVVPDPVKEVEELSPEPAILPEPPTKPTPPVQVASGPSAPAVKSGGVFVGGGRREFPLNGFTSVKVLGSMEVVIAQGPFSVTAEGDAELADELELSVSDRTLVVNTRKSKNSGNSCNRSVTVLVSMPELQRVEVVGSGGVQMAEFTNMRSMELDLRGSGDIRFTDLRGLGTLAVALAGSGDIIGDDAEVSGMTRIALAGSGDVRLGGRTGTMEVSVVGSGDVDVSELGSGSCEVKVTGSGNAYVNCSGRLTREVVGSGEVHEHSSGEGDHGNHSNSY